VARALLRGDLPEDSTVVVDVIDGELTVVPRYPDNEKKAVA
jgi:ATP-dependent Clp protease ATP-binding subunit ClpB